MSDLRPHIQRHQNVRPDLNAQKCLEDALGSIDIHWNNLKEDVTQLRWLVVVPLEAMGFAHYLQADHPGMAHWLRLSVRATLAACRLAEPSAAPFMLDLGLGKPLLLQPTVRPLVTPDRVANAIYAAMILRDQQLLQELADVDLGRLRPPGVEICEWLVDWTHALAGLGTGGDWTGRSFMRALQAADPSLYEPGGLAYASCANLTNPEMALFASLATDSQQFNEALFQAVQAHRDFYGGPEFDPPEFQENDPLGFVALGPLALACRACDLGWPIEVESDYLPQSLIETGELASGA